MSEIKWEIGKWYPCRDGKFESCILVTGMPGKYSVVSAWRKVDNHGFWDVHKCLPDGRLVEDATNSLDLMPPKSPEPKWEVGVWYPCRNNKWEGMVLKMGLPGLYTMLGVRRDIANHKEWWPCTWTPKGLCVSGSKDGADLMPPDPPPEPKRHSVTHWVNCYVRRGEPVVYYSYRSKEEADRHARKDRCDCVPITVEFTEGEGLPASK